MASASTANEFGSACKDAMSSMSDVASQRRQKTCWNGSDRWSALDRGMREIICVPFNEAVIQVGNHDGSCTASNDHGTFKSRCGVRCLRSKRRDLSVFSALLWLWSISPVVLCSSSHIAP